MISLAQPLSYDPNHLLDVVMHRLGLTSDGALAHRLRLARNVIRNIRSGRTPVSATITLVLHQATGFSIDQLRELMGDRRAKFRLSVAVP
jgi:plasmid maintenance system antidote protein VapI